MSMSKTELSLGDALRIGSVAVPAPHSSQIDRCGVGMVYAAHTVRSADCNTIQLIYPGVVDKSWPCPWCAEDGEAHELIGASVIRHPFMQHYLVGQIRIEELAEWLDFIGNDPHWRQLQDRIGTMPKFSTNPAKAVCDGHHGQTGPVPETMEVFHRRGPGAAAVAA